MYCRLFNIHFKFHWLLFLTVLSVSFVTVSGPLKAEKSDNARIESGAIVGGWLEMGWLSENGTRLSVKAKLDTGAKSSSINAPDYRVIKKNGAKWIHFVLTNHKGKSVQIEAPYIRTVRIRRAGVGLSKRPVIHLKICIGGKEEITEFTLADRTQLNYQILIGRKFLANRILVDSGNRFLLNQRCRKQKKKS